VITPQASIFVVIVFGGDEPGQRAGGCYRPDIENAAPFKISFNTSGVRNLIEQVCMGGSLARV
jgi:hypothetical protein